jgi:hypothetical protein
LPGTYDENYNAPISLSDIMLKVTLMLFVMYLAVSVMKKQEDANAPKKAEFMVTMEWDKSRSEYDCDVDMWVRDPDGQIVYFNHQEGAGHNIERDDLGDKNDVVLNSLGQEVVNNEDKEYWYLRAIKPGEYTVNAYMFGCALRDGFIGANDVLNMEVEVKLLRLNPKMEIVSVKNIVLEKIHSERTAMNFVLDAGGTVQSVTDVQVEMVQGAIISTGPNL